MEGYLIYEKVQTFLWTLWSGKFHFPIFQPWFVVVALVSVFVDRSRCYLLCVIFCNICSLGAPENIRSGINSEHCMLFRLLINVKRTLNIILYWFSASVFPRIFGFGFIFIISLNFIQMLPAHMSLVATKSLAHYFLNQRLMCAGSIWMKFNAPAWKSWAFIFSPHHSVGLEAVKIFRTWWSFVHPDRQDWTYVC